jgi:hypothetical protein
MAKQTFSTGQVLTAAQMTSLQANDYNWTVSAKTASYVLAAADAGTRITMNAAGATTITVNTALFTAGDTLDIVNIGAGTCTITAGTATVTSAGSLALTQWSAGTLYFTSASASIFIASGKTTGSSGLTFITGTTFSAAATVSLPASTFSATYANYKIMLDISAASVDSVALRWRMRAAGTDSSATSYTYAVSGSKVDALTFVGATGSNQTSGIFIYVASSDNTSCTFDLIGPQATQNTKLQSIASGRSSDGTFSSMAGMGLFQATTSFDAMTFFPNSGTITGSYKVYGYSNS